MEVYQINFEFFLSKFRSRKKINDEPRNTSNTFRMIQISFLDKCCWAPEASLLNLSAVRGGGAFDSAKNHKRQHRKRQSVTAKREKSQTPKFV